MSPAEKLEQSRLILAKLLEHPKYQAANRLSVYLSTENEVDTKPILRHALEEGGKRCFIPLVQKANLPRQGQTRMIMVELTSMRDYEDLSLNHYGIREPAVCGSRSVAKPASKDNLDLALVPGVAFCLDGRRLGHGKGYYDEFLANWASQAPLYSIGLAFREQLVEEVPTFEGHDVRLDEMLAG